MGRIQFGIKDSFLWRGPHAGAGKEYEGEEQQGQRNVNWLQPSFPVLLQDKVEKLEINLVLGIRKGGRKVFFSGLFFSYFSLSYSLRFVIN